MSLCSGASVNTSSSDKQLDTVACSHEAAASFCDIVWGVVAKLRTSEARGEIYTMSVDGQHCSARLSNSVINIEAVELGFMGISIDP